MRAEKLVVVSGISGSGKSTALHALEDLGYFCVDNLPTPLMDHFVDFLMQLPREWSTEAAAALPVPLDALTSAPRNFALLVDCREDHSVHELLRGVKRLREAGTAVRLLYFDCADEIIVRRYQETRRPHPLLVYSEGGKTIAEALLRERELLADFRGEADRLVDTTSYSVHELRQEIIRFVGAQLKMEVSISSFGFKFGPPTDADTVIDVRFLPNPFFVRTLRELSGLDPAVSEYVIANADAAEFLNHYQRLLDFLVPRYSQEGKKYLTVAVGCTGGRHRSVAIAEALAKHLSASGMRVTTRHRDIDRA